MSQSCQLGGCQRWSSDEFLQGGQNLMAQPDWRKAEDLLYERSQAAIRRFSSEHSDESFSLFVYSVDSMFSGVALNFDTTANSLSEAMGYQGNEVEKRNRLFASDDGWKHARYYVADPTRQIDDYNRLG